MDLNGWDDPRWSALYGAITPQDDPPSFAVDLSIEPPGPDYSLLRRLAQANVPLNTISFDVLDDAAA